ncbi:hypothetical protein ACOME3_003223 [Neoechinorhynchus agilis]
MREQRNSIDAFGVGTHLVTCYKQPALGCVYKLVELNGIPRLKVSDDLTKMLLPYRKRAYRFFGEDGIAICDLLTSYDEPAPEEGKEFLIRHPFVVSKRARERPSIKVLREKLKTKLDYVREDHKRTFGCIPYKVSLSEVLYEKSQSMWNLLTPVALLK